MKFANFFLIGGGGGGGQRNSDPLGVTENACKGYNGGGIIYFHTLNNIVGTGPGSNFEANGESTYFPSPIPHGGGGGKFI